MAEGQQRPLIFISYSSFDTATKEFVQRHFGVLQTLGDIEVWEDGQIGLGDDWFDEIQAKLETCSVAVLLISHDFLGSQFCMKKEVPVLLERRRRDGMMIAPILLSPCAWQIVPWLSAIQMLPQKGKPLLAFDDLEQAEKLTEIVIAIHDFLEERKMEAKEQRIDVKADTPYSPLPEDRIDLTRLPTSGFDVVGRDEELQFLNEAFDGDALNVVSLRAWGGVGKSTLVNKWCEYLAADNFRGARRVFAWSFYSQGTGSGQSGTERVTSADAFIDEALRFFGDDEPEAGSPWSKGERLAELVGKEQALLILDGMEPLQDEHQGIKDPALARLVECLAETNAGLCVITTREPVKEFSDFPETTQEVDLEQLSKEAGRALLRIKGLRATDDLLEQASEAFGNHALALNLLASYLKRFAGGDVRRALAIPDLADVPVEDGKHPRRVMAAFAEAFGEGPELDLLHILGLFDRPADAGCVAALRETPAIPGLTEMLSALDEIGWRGLLEKLRSLGLLADASRHAPNELDSHPLIREHFGAHLKAKREETWKAGHDRLFGYLKTVPEKHQPNTLAEMAPLFQAIHHGCRAGRSREAFDEIYVDRIIRSDEEYLTSMLGLYSTDISLIKSFSGLISEKLNKELLFLLYRTAFGLRALGKLREAVETMQSALSLAVKFKDWGLAAMSAANLSLFQWTNGSLNAAEATAKDAISYSDNADDPFQWICGCVALGRTKHQKGFFKESLEIFEKSKLKKADLKNIDMNGYLYNNYLYCDLLHSIGRLDEMRNVAIQAKIWVVNQEHAPLMAKSFASLSLGYALMSDGSYIDAKANLDSAVEQLRNTSVLDFLPHGLLTRSALSRETGAYEKSRHDLDEVMRLAKRCGMRLHECDAHLEYARLALAEGKPDAALPHFQSADALVTECGYHRRDPEIAELKEKLGL